MKKYISLMLSFLFLVVTGCSQPNVEKEKLESVTLKCDEHVISWEFVQNAEYYEIYVNNYLYDKTSDNNFDLSKLRNDTYQVYVIACDEEKEYLNSLPSLIEVVINNKIEEVPDEDNPGNDDKPIIDDGMGTREIEFFMINDTHGAFYDGEYAGMTRLSSYFSSYDPDDRFVKVANGDIFQGTYISNIFYGLPLVESFNELNFDCFVVGNHEFDWGIEEVAKYKDGNLSNGEANFPFLGANIIDKRTNKIPEWMEPYTIVERNGIRIGIIGAMGETLESSILQTNIQNYEFTEVMPVVKKYAQILRNTEQCDIVVLSIHDYDENLNANVARLTGDERIDLILCGHTHTNNYQEFTRNDGKKIIAVQNQDKNKSASYISVEVIDKQYSSSKFTRIYPANYDIDYAFNNLMNKYNDYVNLGERVLGTASSTISKSTLGYYSTSAMTEYFDVDYSIINTAGVRSNIPSGDITVSDVFNAFPFNNEVFVVELKGSELISLYNKNGSYLYLDRDFNIKNIVSSQVYEIAVIDYVFTGVYYTEFKNKSYNDTDILLRDILIEYIDELY